MQRKRTEIKMIGDYMVCRAEDRVRICEVKLVQSKRKQPMPEK